MHRTTIVTCTAAALAALSTATAVAAAPATTTVAARPTAVAARPAAATPAVKRSYLVATHVGRTARLQLVSRATGAVTATLATAPMTGGRNPLQGASIAPDGSVLVVKEGRTPYDGQLLRIRGGRVTALMTGVQAAKVSPDGRRLAVTRLSPDTDRDGRGTASLQVGPVSGTGMRPIAEETFPVRGGGLPAHDQAIPMVRTWLGNHDMAVAWGVEDNGNVAVVSADRPSTMRSWPRVSGDSSTDVAGVVGSIAVVPVYVKNGYDMVHVSPARPRGVKVAHLRFTRDSVTPVKSYLRKIGAAPVDATYARLPYRATKGVVLDRKFTGR
ncbi:hypothetical protein [Arsenicicoccus dermatophilus]|uniref:hypothetical protein n=1 Tax=Arsenicicoccus dermatophilus TaxID=1076331 RepID=UPI001F4C5FAF|nr:hypothetical protein [Arsenicicoccus dermatophilus]MCH8613526.1 hypothetical protein [Arsenicicoccus dermatophilus]